MPVSRAILEGSEKVLLGFAWEAIHHNGRKVGDKTNCVWSPRMEANIGYALISREVLAGDSVEVQRKGGTVAAEQVELPFSPL